MRDKRWEIQRENIRNTEEREVKLDSADKGQTKQQVTKHEIKDKIMTKQCKTKHRDMNRHEDIREERDMM